MNISVTVNTGTNSGYPEKVINIGLLSDKQNYLIIVGITAIVGIMLLYFANKSKTQVFETNTTSPVNSFLDRTSFCHNYYFYMNYEKRI